MYQKMVNFEPRICLTLYVYILIVTTTFHIKNKINKIGILLIL